MCLKCHQGLSDEAVLNDLKDSLKTPQFEKWNSTSLSHLFITSVGYNGKEAQTIANQLLNSYVQWAENNKDREDMGTMFGPPDSEYAKAVVEFSADVQAKFLEEGLMQEQIKDKVLNDKTTLANYPKEPAKARIMPERVAKPGYPTLYRQYTLADFRTDLNNWLNPISWWKWLKC